MVDLETQNNGMRYTCFIVIFLCVIAGLWYLFSRPEHGGNIDNIETGLDNIAAEQRRAEESLGRIREGIDRSEESLGRITDSVERSGELIGSVRDDVGRITGEVDSAIEGIRSAETRNREVEERIGDVRERIRDGIRRADESESIFAKYAGGNQGK